MTETKKSYWREEEAQRINFNQMSTSCHFVALKSKGKSVRNNLADILSRIIYYYISMLKETNI